MNIEWGVILVNYFSFYLDGGIGSFLTFWTIFMLNSTDYTCFSLSWLKLEFLNSCTLRNGQGWQSWMIIFLLHSLDFWMSCLYFWIPLFHWEWEYLRIIKTMKSCLAISQILLKLTSKILKIVCYGEYFYLMGTYWKVLYHFSHFQEWWLTYNDFCHNLVEHVYNQVLWEMER